ncbi:MAG: hypothetical protein A2365_00215 [Candidatus Nealsonbacteria bacterium RIFOXYB1_FULL_40_15]|uniref:Uncharacterized protein n=2 Tax=Candidatus Nealsoniibacteriota TaxID=1817911 RepID=A0A1G2ESL6_9BACT|nr:MAG: hypothetical protein A2365_00215 [Candidatus Nealsonbacteria bacterium RIFOXYB1_FULL_40_15]OGZ28094.1 MAG: hypothetical protein A2562_01710 [Candidatus Nealsonbacteria bacterium RIFOXYD1_FULL_39_11]OGZ28717.1 MAG: hypothetical protein A2427_03520 [Candidatus Nealsonbacteria bacterium RIFOXYC1_FULL_40_7]
MPSTQDFLQFDQIRDGILILKNKGLRSVLMISSLNFVLKSPEEQEAILYQFQNFLNSLDFSCQILVSSRRLNITGYLDRLEKIEQKEESELLRIQIAEYRKFIEEIIGGGSVMQKAFYIIVPFSIMEAQSISQQLRPTKVSEITEEMFQRAKVQLMQRVEFVALGLRSCSLEAVPLNTLEVSELLWGIYHPSEAERGYYPEFPEELME